MNNMDPMENRKYISGPLHITVINSKDRSLFISHPSSELLTDKQALDLIHLTIEEIFKADRKEVWLLTSKVQTTFKDLSFDYDSCTFCLYLFRLFSGHFLQAPAFVPPAYLLYAFYKIQQHATGDILKYPRPDILISQVIRILQEVPAGERDARIRECVTLHLQNTPNAQPAFLASLQNTIHKVMEELENAVSHLKEATGLRANRRYKSRFLSKTGEQLYTIPAGNINCFFSSDKATYLLTNEGRKYLIDHCLQEIEGLVDPDLFFRINRQYLIRDTAITKIIEFSHGRLKVYLKHIDDTDIVISRERGQMFRQWLDL